MAIQVGDILRFTACQNLFGETACNVFYYVVAAWTGNLSYSDALDEFLTAVGAKQAAMQSTAVTWEQIKVENVTNGVDFDIKTSGLPSGGTTGDSLPSYVAAGFRLDRETGVTRNGFKRVAGIIEAQVLGNVFTGASDGDTVAYANALNDSLILDVNDELVPVIVGRNANGTLDLTRINNITTVTIKPNITTQNSRKKA